MYLQVPGPQSIWQYGCSFFRRRKDPSLPRGYFQQSVAVLSPLPYYAVFKKVIATIAPVYFKHGDAILATAWEDILRWPPPVLGKEYQLPLLGEVLRVHLPYPSVKRNHGPTQGSGLSLIRARSAEAMTKESIKAAESKKGGPSGFHALPASFLLELEKGGPMEDLEDPLRGEGEAMSASWRHGEGEEATAASGPELASPLSPKSELRMSVDEVFESMHIERPGLFQDVNLFLCFKSLLGRMWTLWELAITGQPVLIMASSPGTCSDSVLGFTSLISPVVYSADYRPFFTIHNSDFQYVTKEGFSEPRVLGVTNHFFEKVVD